MQSYFYRVGSRLLPPWIMAMGFGVFPLVLEGAAKRGLLLFVILAPFYYLRAAILASGTVLRSEGISGSQIPAIRSRRLAGNFLVGCIQVPGGIAVYLSGYQEAQHLLRPHNKILANY